MTVRDLVARLAATPLLIVSAGPLLLALFVLFGPFLTDPMYMHSGLGVGVGGQVTGGVSTIDPNIAITSFALGLRAAQDVIAGHLPLWNHFQGFGAPLLGEMQSAALFPPTLLLLLPNGQALEHIFLQWVAGIGAFLFFRRFGLSTAAAVIGAVLYEFNGIFATLRNAAFNPVAFLPWLLFGIEMLRTQIWESRPYAERITTICVTGLAGALALYAGFPETAYLYGLLVVAWGLFRMVGLERAQAGHLIGGLAAAAALALALSAPLLIAFAAYLAEGHVGGHGESFVGMVQEKETSLLYLLPYFYGPFVASADARIAGLSISSGGYIAVAPMALAAAALAAPGHRAVKVFLSACIVIALGASHGWPVIYPIFMSLPLMELAIPGRYLNASWIFCVIFLAALLIDRLPHLTAGERKRCIGAALLMAVVAGIAVAIPAAEMLPRAWASVPSAVIGSLAAGTAALIGMALAIAMQAPRLRAIALAMAALEAVGLFIVPFLSYPRFGKIDTATLAFLQNNTGYQRVAKTDGLGLRANFGSAFGVGLIHFDDLPSPRRTIDYVRAHLDQYADHIFLPEYPALAEKELAERKHLFRERLPAYAHAGVKYVMASPAFYGESAGDVIWRDERPVVLKENELLKVESRHTTSTVTVNALTVRTSNFRNTTTGTLHVELCSSGACTEGAADFASVDDGQLMLIPLRAPLALEAGSAFTAAFRKLGATEGVIWAYPRHDAAPLQRILESPRAVDNAYGIELAFIPEGRPQPVHVGRSMAVYELPDVRPYASAGECEVKLRSHDEIETHCQHPSKLTRLNVHMTGWQARVNGVETPIRLEDETFQVVDVPAGAARIVFDYTPPGLRPALGVGGIALILLMGGFALGLKRRYRSRGQNSADETPALP